MGGRGAAWGAGSLAAERALRPLRGRSNRPTACGSSSYFVPYFVVRTEQHRVCPAGRGLSAVALRESGLAVLMYEYEVRHTASVHQIKIEFWPCLAVRIWTGISILNDFVL